VKQMRGEYKVKNAALKTLSTQAAALGRGLGSVTYTAVRREHNELADRLVNEALDAYLDVSQSPPRRWMCSSARPFLSSGCVRYMGSSPARVVPSRNTNSGTT